MKCIVSGRKVFQIFLTIEHLMLLTKCSKVHYDFACTYASRRGGFLYGWMGRAEFHAEHLGEDHGCEPFSVFAEFGELDTCLKMLEIASAPFSSEPEKKRDCLELATHLRKALQAANAITDWVREIEV